MPGAPPLARPPYKGVEHGTTSGVLEFWGTAPKPMLSPTLKRLPLHHDPAEIPLLQRAFLDSGSSPSNRVEVQVLSFAPTNPAGETIRPAPDVTSPRRARLDARGLALDHLSSDPRIFDRDVAEGEADALGPELGGGGTARVADELREIGRRGCVSGWHGTDGRAIERRRQRRRQFARTAASRAAGAIETPARSRGILRCPPRKWPRLGQVSAR